MSDTDARGVFLRFEIQHIFVNEIVTTEAARDARRLLASIDFNLESCGKITVPVY